MEIQEMLTKIRSVAICLNSHPDCEDDSEFQDRIDDLLKIEAGLKARICEVSGTHRNQIVKDLIESNEILKKELREAREIVFSSTDENIRLNAKVEELAEINAQLQKSNRKLLKTVSIYNEK